MVTLKDIIFISLKFIERLRTVSPLNFYSQRTNMNSDAIYAMIKHQAELKCGSLWSAMNEKEQLRAMIKISIVLIKELK